MKQLQLFRLVRQGECIPSWYGVAWQDWMMDGYWAAPIFLALPIGVARYLWAGLRTGSHAVARDARVAYLDGIQQGILIARKDPSLLRRSFVLKAGNRATTINADAYDQRGGK